MAAGDVGQSQPPELRIILLGAFRVQAGGRDVLEREWKRRSAAAIVKILALTPGHRLHREQLMELLWPDSDPEQASNNLYQALYAARRALGSDAGRYLVLHDQIIQFASDLVLSVDTHEFVNEVDQARRSRSATAYRTALNRFTGELLPDDRYEIWVAHPREVLDSLFAEAALELAGLEDGTDDYSTVTAALERVVGVDPLHELAHRALIQIYTKTGQRHRALRLYESLEAALAEELGVEPDPATAELVARIRSGELAETSAPSEDSAKVAGEARHNLPETVNRFIGRQRELSQVRQALTGTRLLTLTGPGGCGKTRLAFELAQSLTDDFEDGIWLVELAALTDPGLVPQQIASALEIREMAGQPVMDSLIRWFRTRRALLVLDNCEHLIEPCARIAEALLRASPGLQVLATSREPLRIHGETTWIVPSLSLPEPSSRYRPEELLEYEAVQLFVDRASQVAPAFKLTAENAGGVAELCYRLDGIPLALELAAARTRALTVEQIVERLDDRFRLLRGGSRAALSRQQTLRAALDWSHDLLSEPERVLFARLSVFAGDFTLEAAERVCGLLPLDADDIIDLLSALVDRSLVMAFESHGTGRYRLLESMRQYGHGRLTETGDREAIAQSHAAYFAELGARGSQEIRSARQREWLNLLEREHDNLRAALEWLRKRAESGDAEPGLLLTGQLHWFWHLQGHFSEGRARLEQMRAASGERETAGYASALTGIGDLALAVGDYRTGRDALAQSAAISRKLDDPAGLALAVNWLGWAELFHGQVADAQACHREGLELFTRLGDRWGTAMAWLGQGFDAAELNDLNAAREAFEQALALFRDIGDDWGIATTLKQVAHLTYRSGDLETARAQMDDILKIVQQMGDAWQEVESWGLLAEIARASGDTETAAVASAAGLEIATEIGHFALHAWILRDAGFVALEQGRTGQARVHFIESLTIFREHDYPLGAVCAMVGLAGVAASESDHGLAAYLLGAGQTELQRIGVALAPADRLASEAIARSTQQTIGSDAFERERRRGAEALFSEAVDLVGRHGRKTTGEPPGIERL